MPLLVLGYWEIHGLVQGVRLLMNYLGVEYEDRRYAFGPAPDYNRDSWLVDKNDKTRLGLRFPNLPYLLEDTYKLTESKAILKYIARTRGPQLYPTDAKTLALLDEVEGVARDLQRALIDVTYGRATFDSAKTIYLDDKLPHLNSFLRRRKYVASEHLTYIDFYLYEVLDQLKKLGETINVDILEPYPDVRKYVRTFESIPELKEYLEQNSKLKYYSPYASILY